MRIGLPGACFKASHGPSSGLRWAARQAARAEGIFSGPSTGANLAAALSIARRLGPGHRVVAIQVDSGLEYLTGQLYC